MRDDSDDDEERTTMTKKPRTINETSPPSTPSSSRKDCSPLWHLVTDLPLLFSEKILDTKLDKASVKLFFETNRAARALVKNYSPRVYQTHVRGEMLGKESSSSNNNNNNDNSDEAVVEGAVESLCFSRETLKYCFERYAWGFENNVFKFYPGRGSGRFARIVASTNKLELLKYAREEAKCDWDKDVLIEAAQHANYEMMKYCIENQCPLESADTYLGVLRYGYRAKGGKPLECLRYLRETARAPWYDFVLFDAIDAFQGFDIPRDNTEEENEIVFKALKYVVENGCPIQEEEATSYAVDMVNQGEVQFKAFKYLVEEAKVIPLNSWTLMRVDFYSRLWSLELSLRNVVVGEEPLLTEEQYVRNCRVGAYLRQKGCPPPTSLVDEFLVFRGAMSSYKDEFVDEHAESLFWSDFAQFYGFDPFMIVENSLALGEEEEF